ncbi:MAG: heme-binding domain-containing protein [Nitrospinae bacterium]|nr:heme-binding domain-containing protein [Nitrospinota bacterium]
MSHLSLKHIAGVVAAIAFLFPAVTILAHGGKEHGKGGETPAAAGQSAAPPPDAVALNVINNHYLRDVKPIFKRVCFDCHSEQIRYPAYYVIPGIRQLIDHDIREAREHIDMNADYPFKGHGTPLKDLKAIQKEMEEGDMPPLRYKITHWKERLTGEEKQIILRWATDGIKLLPAAPEEPAPAAGK